MKYNSTIVKHITDMIASDEYTIEEICRAVKISKETFYTWKEKKTDFADAIKKAEVARMNFFRVEARKAAVKKLQGYDYEETTTIFIEGKDGKPRPKEKKVIKKHVPPDTAMIIFTLKNTDPENFKDNQYIDHTTLGEKINPVILSQDEINKAIEKL